MEDVVTTLAETLGEIYPNPNSIYMIYLSIIRGEQATLQVTYGEYSMIYDDTEFRIHVQNVILQALL